MELEQIILSINELSYENFKKVRDLVLEKDCQLWDEQIEVDSKNGKMDNIAKQAIKEFKKGNYKAL
jgi:hypothetical protein